MAFAKAFVILG